MNVRSLTRQLFRTALTAAVLAAPALAHDGHDHGLSVLRIEGKDHSYSNPAAVQPGWTRVEFRNTGQEAHHVQIIRLPRGQTAQGFLSELAKNEGAALASAEMVGGVGMITPGSSGSVTLDLQEEGTYLTVCFVTDAKGVPHLALGMVGSFEVKGERQTTQPPKASVKVQLEDFSFQLPETLVAGKQVWEVVNAGPEPHEMLIFKLAPGKTMADFAEYMAKPEGPMPAIPVGGAQAANKGRSSFVDLDLEAGEYILVCAIPSAAHHGETHAALGMIRPITVAAGTAQQ
ncbi:plastocyanin [Deinobacterium chartae]|uniref:Plastocyanin n=1 Tax=Deinobacterium chartae TaxID=521158 RepID=A0A841I5V7_9DEIO|nr:hypothetical protein [Deinobacterium chartae]MBB6099838.1 plastocyanin [Deinobacterium chartae]